MRGRMPGGILLATALVVMAGVLARPESAHADPHAVFYTAIGQRQLFFNVLAGLNQADYVEPVLGNFSRDELRQQRDAALRAEATAVGKTVNLTEDPVSAATKTELSGLVVRPITLEGNDLYTQLTARDRAVEAKRQSGLADLLTRTFCRALGREKCSDDQGALLSRSKAYVTDPIKWGAAPYMNGFLANLFSGTPEHDARRQAIKASAQFEPGFLYSKSIGELYKSLTGAGQQQMSATTLRTALSALPLVPHPDTFKDVNVDANGNASLAFAAPQRGVTNTALAAETTDEFMARYLEKTRQQLYFTQALRATAEHGAADISQIQNVVEADGEVADVKLKAKNEPDCTVNADGKVVNCKAPPEDPNDFTLLPAIQVPVAGKLAQVDAAAQGLADANTGLHDASVQALQQPEGNAQLIRGQDQSAVLGTTTGQVAGEITNTNIQFAPVARAVNEGFPHTGQELGHVVEAFNNGRYTSTRCGCALNNTANAFGSQIIAAINRRSL